MEKILNSVEELYQLITGTLPVGYVETVTKQYGVPIHPTDYFAITDFASHDRVKIEYGKNYRLVITDGRIYKYA